MQTYLSVPADNKTLVAGSNRLIMVLVMVGALFKWFALGPSSPPLPSLAVVTVCVANSIYLARGGSDEIGAWVLVTISLAGLVAAGYNSGGFGGPILLLASLVPVVALLLLNGIAGWVALALTVMILSSFLWLHMEGAVPKNPNSALGVLIGRYLALTFSSLVITWILWSFAESKRALLNANESLANTDHLTGLPNRRSFEASLDRETKRARRGRTPLSLLMIDVDHFKRYNDVNGHPAGDSCLVAVAQVINACLHRPADLSGRLGGEEFVAILPETDAAGAMIVAENMCRAMRERAIRYEPAETDVVTVTIGAVSCDGHLLGDNPAALLDAADKALYEGKDQGRDRVVEAVFEPAASA